MARPRARELATLRAELVGAVGRYDEAAIRRGQAEGAYLSTRRGVDTGRPAPDAILAHEQAAEERIQAERAQLRAAATMRTALGRYLALVHDTARDRALWRELEAIAPGLAADAREVHDMRRRGEL